MRNMLEIFSWRKKIRLNGKNRWSNGKIKILTASFMGKLLNIS